MTWLERIGATKTLAELEMLAVEIAKLGAHERGPLRRPWWAQRELLRRMAEAPQETRNSSRFSTFRSRPGWRP